MRRPLLIAVIAFLACAARAGDEGDSLRSKSLAAAAAALPARSAAAPFRSARDPMPALLLREELAARGPRGSCAENAGDFCYDLDGGRVVYRPARRYMPRIDGLRAESISVRRDRVILKYSFR